jgi:hypothetical protein
MGGPIGCLGASITASTSFKGRIAIMGLFGRKSTKPARAGRKPTRGERRAAERTAQAEANLERTEEQIHQLADEVRRDLRP